VLGTPPGVGCAKWRDPVPTLNRPRPARAGLLYPLFLRDGHFRTITKAIASETGVAEMTLFLTFKNKANLFSEIIHVNIRGHDEDHPMASTVARQGMLAAQPDEIVTTSQSATRRSSAAPRNCSPSPKPCPTLTLPPAETSRTPTSDQTSNGSLTRSHVTDNYTQHSHPRKPQTRSTRSPTPPAAVYSSTIAAGGAARTANGSRTLPLTRDGT
jgi:Bacterial regulatory proteins, tetR family